MTSATDELLKKLRMLKYDYDSMSTSCEDAIDEIADELEQAIAATLGRGTCKLEGFADVRFSVDYEVEGYAVGSSSDYATLEECSSCGAYVIEPPAYHHVLTCDGDEIYQPYNYCPNCGAKVVKR